MTVAAILKHKGRDVAWISPTATVADIVRRLAERRIGAVLVMDASEQMLGIASERDVIRCLAEHGVQALDMTVGQLMTRHVYTATPRTTVAQAMEMMTAGRFRHLPILDNEELCGIVSIGDVVKARIMQQEQEVDSLKAYVAGGV